MSERRRSTRSKRKKNTNDADDSEGDLPDISAIIKGTKKARTSTAQQGLSPPLGPADDALEVNTSTQDSAAGTDTQVDVSADAQRRYPTRSGERHPGVKAGLAVRTRQEIQAAAKAKKDQIEAEHAQQAADRAASKAKHEQQVGKLAKLLDKQSREEVDEAMAFDMPPSNGDSSSDENTAPPTPKATRKDNVIEHEDIDNEPDAPAKRKAPTQKERRAQRQQDVRSNLQAHRMVVAQPVIVQDTPRETRAITSTLLKPGAKDKLDAFNPAWRRRLLEHTKSPAAAAPKARSSVPKASSVRQSSMAPLTFRKAGASLKDLSLEDNDPNFVPIRGLDAADIDAPRDAALSTIRRIVLASPAGTRLPERMLDVADIPESEVPAAEEKKKKKKKKKGKKRPSGSDDGSDSPSSDDNSCSYEKLPAWTKPLIKDEVMPTVYEYLGTQDNPWSLKTTKYSFIQLLQSIFDDVFPRKYFRLLKSDMIYKWCQQQVYEWQRGFQRAANHAVRAEIDIRRSDKTRPKEERTEVGIMTWLRDALALGGAAHWGRPDVTDPSRAKEQLQSQFVLKVLAYHFRQSVGSIFVPEADERAEPIGALALAACAVERAFRWYSDNQLKGLPQTKFSNRVAGQDTGKWRDTAVQELIDKPHRLERLLANAAELAATQLQPVAPVHGVNPLYVRERSSSPPAAPFDVDTE